MKTDVPEVVKINDLVAYQNGSVVSRTLMEKDCGTVTAFAFDENQGLSEHTSPYDALIITIEGKVDITISGDEFHLEEGQIIILPANKPHALKAATKFKMLLVMVHAKP